MNIVPASKIDLDACENLARASDDEVIKNISELLQWVQDINWPVAPLICKRLESLGGSLVAPVKNILNGEDDIWKYWVISSLLSEVPSTVVRELRSELEVIAENPSRGEKAEGVNVVAKELLDKCR